MGNSEQAVELVTTQLLDFLEELRNDGFEIGVDQLVVSCEIVIHATGVPHRDAEASRFRTLLAPIVCKDPTEQRRFGELFDDWLRRNQFEPVPHSESKHDDSFEQTEPAQVQLQEGKRWLAAAIAVTLAVLVVAILTGLSKFGPWQTETSVAQTEQIVGFQNAESTDENQPETDEPNAPETGTDREAGQTPLAGSGGDARPLTDDPDNAIEGDDSNRRAVGFERTGEQDANQPLGLDSDRNLNTPDAAATGSPGNGDTDSDADGRPIHRSYWIALLFSMPFVLSAVWVVTDWWWIRWSKRFLVKRRVSEDFVPQMSSIHLDLPSPLFRSSSFLQTIHRLRRHLPIATQSLDVQKTAEATAKNAGSFSPIQQTRRVTPEYLVLVERSMPEDHQSRFVDTLLHEFDENGIHYTRLYFDADARYCYSPASAHRHVRLSELRSHHSHDRLLLFSQPDKFIDAFSGEAVSWITQFHAWENRFLLAFPSADDHALQYEKLDRHFRIVWAGEQGLGHIADFLYGNVELGGLRFKPRNYPPSLRFDSERWVEPYGQDAPVTEQLIQELREYLGEAGFYWMCATAMFPSLTWDITCFLGGALTHNDATLFSETRLVKLSQLPWYRRGSLPDWMRRRLIDELSREQRQETREAISRLLLSSLGASPSGASLMFAQMPKKTATDVCKKLMTYLSRRSAANHPARDLIFLSAMSSPLSVSLPGPVDRLVTGVRRAPTLARAGIAAALCLLFLAIIPIFLNDPSRETARVPNTQNGNVNATETKNDDATDVGNLDTDALAPPDLLVEADADSNQATTIDSDRIAARKAAANSTLIRLGDLMDPEGTADPVFRLNVSGHTGLVRTLDLSNDGNTMVSGGEGKNLQVWTRTDANPSWTHSRLIRWPIARGPRGVIFTARIRKNQVAFAGYGAFGTSSEIRIVDVNNGKLQQALTTEDSIGVPTLNLAWSPSETPRLASIDMGGRVMDWQADPATGIWRPKTWMDSDRVTYGEEIANELQNVSRSFGALSYLGERYLVIPKLDLDRKSTDRIWHLERINLETEQRDSLDQFDHRGDVRCITTTDDGRVMATVERGDDSSGSVGVWTFREDGSVDSFQTLTPSKPPLSADVDPSGERLLVGTEVDGDKSRAAIEVWDISASPAKRLSLQGTGETAYAVALNANHRELIYTQSNTIEVRPFGDTRPTILASPVRPVLKVAFKNDTSYQLAVGWSRSPDGTRVLDRLFDLEAQTLLPESPIDSSKYLRPQRTAERWSIQMDPTGRAMLMENGTPRGTLPLDAFRHGRPTAIATLPDPASIDDTATAPPTGAVVVGTSGNHNIYVYRAGTSDPPELLRQFRGHTGDVLSLSSSRDGKYLVSGSTDATLAIWSLEGIFTDSEMMNRWGVQWTIENDRLIATDVRKAGPMYDRGVRQGDQLVRIQWVDMSFSSSVETGAEKMRQKLNELPFDTPVVFEFARSGRAIGPFRSAPVWPPLASGLVSTAGEWAFWSPFGYYNASPEGDQLFGWQLNPKQIEGPAQFFPARQFRDALYRPEMMQRLLASGDLPTAAKFGTLQGKVNARGRFRGSFYLYTDPASSPVSESAAIGPPVFRFHDVAEGEYTLIFRGSMDAEDNAEFTWESVNVKFDGESMTMDAELDLPVRRREMSRVPSMFGD